MGLKIFYIITLLRAPLFPLFLVSFYQGATDNYKSGKWPVNVFLFELPCKHLHFRFLEMALLFILSLLFLPVAKSQVSVAYEIYLSSVFYLQRY
jgi:hypothetical protein